MEKWLIPSSYFLDILYTDRELLYLDQQCIYKMLHRNSGSQVYEHTEMT